MITVEALKNALEEMKTVYKFDDKETVFRMSRDLKMYSETVEIKTIDEKTGIEVIMAKNVAEDARKEDIYG